MMHLTERSGGDFGLVYRYYLSLEQELAAGKPLVFLTFVYDREKIQFLSFMMHLTERSGGDFGLVYRYYLSLEQELAAGKATWRDSIGRRSLDHFETVFFKIGIHVASCNLSFHIHVFCTRGA
jgi:hypothetical protein